MLDGEMNEVVGKLESLPEHTKETMGSRCTAAHCSCPSFVTGGKNEAQWCENCGHARSLHSG